jgi:hypothetical protein
MEKFVKIGSIWFNPENVKKMSYKEFVKTYTGAGIDLESTYKKLGGKIRGSNKKEPKKDPEKID